MHRDLKPANILVTRDRRTLKLADFGLAKSFPRCRCQPSDDPAPLRGRSSPDHTSCIGTPRYAAPEVLAHNLETVPRLYLSIRPGARYYPSLRLLERVKERTPAMFTKSGVMVGLGESKEEVMQVMDDMRSAGIDFLTIGQYLQPTRKHAAVDRFVTPDEFKAYEEIAYAKGFMMVSASPLTRSSHHAGEDFARLKAARLAKTGV